MSASLLYGIGLGSNLGDRRGNILEAARRLESILEHVAMAKIIESGAVDGKGSPDPGSPGYLNTAIRGETRLEPEELLRELQAIEESLGRDMAEKSLYRPRVIDLDILLAFRDGAPIHRDTPALTVPHPRILERSFVLEPLVELGFDRAAVEEYLA